MQMNIKETAALLGVSIQTLRNWDENGYLKANRTAGGHRRYSTSDINSLSEEKNYNVLSSWECQHLFHIEKMLEQEGEKDQRAKPCGAFTKSQIGMLLKNQDTAHDPETQKLNKDLDFFFELASSMSAPYLFQTSVMPYCNSLILTRKVRDNLVFESEDISANSYKKEYGWDGNVKNTFKEIVDEIDGSCIKNVIDSTKFLTNCHQDQMEESIFDIIQKIDESTNTKEPKIVVIPPELSNYKDNIIKLTENLKKVSHEFEHNYTMFISRMMPKNKILVGTKSNNKFGGFVFCPYMLMCHHAEQNKVMMRVSKKLLREGSKHYGLITVE